MSGLKAGVIVTPHDEGMSFDRGSDAIAVTERETEFYLKSEADKQLRHHKYKRCLAMAYVEWLKQVIIGLHPESILYRKAFKRERKWKELAEKFKEAK